jgi:prefoldin subunit 5
MTQPNHQDLNRALGRVEGEMAGVKESMDQIRSLLASIDDRLGTLEDKENQRKGALAALMVFSGFVGGLIAKFGAFIFGGH